LSWGEPRYKAKGALCGRLPQEVVSSAPLFQLSESLSGKSERYRAGPLDAIERGVVYSNKTRVGEMGLRPATS
jgi:hypothetical protein